MNNKNRWINRLFNSFNNSSNIPLLFEEDVKRHQGPVISLSVHPIRFADDIFFNFQTNSEELRGKLKKYEVNYDIFYHYADIAQATFLKSVKKNNIKENALLLVGQTEKDQVIFDGEKFLSLLDYIDELKTIAKCYNTIYFKPHPYAKNNQHIYKVLKNEFKNIVMIYDNIYHLLSNENIKHIVGLNSSVLYEAKYFSKEVTFLYKESFDIGEDDIGIYGDYFTSSFWSDVLGVEDTKTSLPFMPNRLRKSINDFWGYNTISDEIILKDIVKSKFKYFMYKYF